MLEVFFVDGVVIVVGIVAVVVVVVELYCSSL
jgi:hypothetical protein